MIKEKFIIGLGNPGKEYIKNRHNIGFLLLENFSEKYDSKFTLKNKLKSWYSEFKINNSTYRLFMPNTFMNFLIFKMLNKLKEKINLEDFLSLFY